MVPAHADARTAPPREVRPELGLHVDSEQPLCARKNRLLDFLPAAVLQRWRAQLEVIELPLGKVLCEPGACLTHVIFPTTAIVSLASLTENGNATSTALIGNEGMLGTWLPMGAGSAQFRAVVLSAGRGLRLSASSLLAEFNRAGPVMRMLLCYTQTLLTQIGQAVACNRHHSIEQHLCHLLMLTLDRLSSNHIVMTQELIASMMGVRREGVTDAVGRLRRAGLISCRRGHISVLDREGLEARSCECYRVIRDEHDRLLPAELATCPRLRHRDGGSAAGCDSCKMIEIITPLAMAAGPPSLLHCARG